MFRQERTNSQKGSQDEGSWDKPGTFLLSWLCRPLQQHLWGIKRLYKKPHRDWRPFILHMAAQADISWITETLVRASRGGSLSADNLKTALSPYSASPEGRLQTTDWDLESIRELQSEVINHTTVKVIRVWRRFPAASRPLRAQTSVTAYTETKRHYSRKLIK